MRYETYFDAFASSQSHLFSDISGLRRRLTCEGPVAFATGMKEASDAVLTGLANHGSLSLGRLPFVPRNCFRPGLSVRRHSAGVLDFLLMFNKLQVDGRELPSGIPSFLDRNRETSCFAGRTWEDILPLEGEVKQWIAQFFGKVPTVLTGCKHGPGATAETLTSWDKWLAVLEEHRRQSAIRLTEVPKDFRRKRLIGIEPTWKQFLQQGIAHALRRRAAQSAKRCGPCGPLRFLQDVKQHVAYACTEGTLTVDLEDASDRIPLSLVEYLVPPEWYRLFASVSTGLARERSEGEERVHTLAMMATMGNGFCFELESLIFHLVAAIASFNSQGDRKFRSFNACMGQISVFGDDIVLRDRDLLETERVFELCGFRINKKKTCRTEQFRETCGFWIPLCVGVPRFTPQLCGNGSELHFETQVARVDLAARALDAGYAKLAMALLEPLRDAPRRWNKKLQRYEISLTCLKSVTRRANVADEIRHLAYWKTGLSDAELEHCTLRAARKWVPIGPDNEFLNHAADLGVLTGYHARLFGRVYWSDFEG